MEKLKELVLKEGYTCAIESDGKLFVSVERGVKPLLDFINDGLKGGRAADKVVGNGAAYLYVLLEITELHAFVISRPALETLKKYNISVTYDALVDNIINRSKTDICPMEKAVIPATTPWEARELIIEKLKKMPIG